MHLDQGKTYKITPGKFDITKLEERNRYKCTIGNIPTTIFDSLLLRQLRKYKVQAVYILNNHNGNQTKRAHIYFKSEEDLIQAQRYSLYYYNTKLEWQSGFDNTDNETYNRDQSGHKRSLNEIEASKIQRLVKKPRNVSNKGKQNSRQEENSENKDRSYDSAKFRLQLKEKTPLRDVSNKAIGNNIKKMSLKNESQEFNHNEAKSSRENKKKADNYKEEINSNDYKQILIEILERLNRIKRRHLEAEAPNYS